jgi:hypothetical protein
VASTAVSSVKRAVADSDDVGKAAVSSRCNNGPRTPPWGTPALTEEGSVCTVLIFTMKCLVCK